MTRPKDKKVYLSKVNSPPRGLQNLLGNVNQGINPHELDHKIAPGVDLYQFWGVNKLHHKLSAAWVAGNVGQYHAIFVPEGELWQVVAASCNYDNAGVTADDTSIHLAIMPPTLAGDVAVFTRSFTDVPGGALSHLTAGGLFPDRFILSGGWGIAGVVDGSSVATARDMSVSVLYIKLTD